MKKFKLNLSRMISLIILLAFGLNILADIGLSSTAEVDSHSSIVESSRVEVSTVDADPSESKEHCNDPCHAGACHFGHCAHILTTKHIYRHYFLSLAHVPVTDSAPSMPNLESMKRPPRLS